MDFFDVFVVVFIVVDVFFVLVFVIIMVVVGGSGGDDVDSCKIEVEGECVIIVVFGNWWCRWGGWVDWYKFDWVG